VNATTELSKDWKVTFSESLRFGDNATRFYYNYSEIGLNYSGLAEWLNVGTNYRKSYIKNDESEWYQEDSPHFNLTVKGTYRDLGLSNRVRLAYRDRGDGDDDVWQIRDLITVRFPVELTELKMQPYVSEEVFIHLDDEGFYMNRIYAGFSFKIFTNTTCRFYYLYEHCKSDCDWDGSNIIGTTFDFTF
jgi:hypothetical protein